MLKFTHSMALTIMALCLLTAAGFTSAATLISVGLGWAGDGPGAQSGTGPTPSQSGHLVPFGTVAAAPSMGNNNWDYLGVDASYTSPFTLSAMDDSNGNPTTVSMTYTLGHGRSYPGAVNQGPWIQRTASGTPIVPKAVAFISFPGATWNTNNGTDESSPKNPFTDTLTFSGLNPGGTYDLYIYSAYMDGNTAAGANTPTVSLQLVKGSAAVASYTYTYNMSDPKLLSSYRRGTNYEEFRNVKPNRAGQIQVKGSAVNSSLFNAVQLVTRSGKSGKVAPVHFFRVAKVHGLWWVINPQGKRTLVKGVDEVRTLPHIERLEGVYGKEMIPTDLLMPWQGTHRCRPTSLLSLDIQARRLLAWGFNNIGPWSDPQCAGAKFKGRQLSLSAVLNIGVGYAGARHESFPDVFNPHFAVFADRLCQRRCTPWKNDSNFLGWYSDNELDGGWGPGWVSPVVDGILMRFLDFPPQTPGHNAAVAFLKKCYGKISALNKAWRTQYKSWHALGLAQHIPEPFIGSQLQTAAGTQYLQYDRTFTGMVARRYSRVCRDAIKAADPNHLYLGQKFPGWPGALVAAADAKYTDVISVDIYNVTNPTPLLKKFAAFDKPMIIAEFSFRAKDSGLPNTIGAGLLVNTQTQRAADTVRYLRYALAVPQVVGYDWWEYMDEPRWGRWPSPLYSGGENSNYGLIRRNGTVYKRMTQAFTKFNAEADGLHASATIHP
ncbi:MAG: beta-galactosidase [Phycisphaerae bacterium]